MTQSGGGAVGFALFAVRSVHVKQSVTWGHTLEALEGKGEKTTRREEEGGREGGKKDTLAFLTCGKTHSAEPRGNSITLDQNNSFK